MAKTYKPLTNIDPNKIGKPGFVSAYQLEDLEDEKTINPQADADARAPRYDVASDEDPLSQFTSEYFEGLRRTPLTPEEESKIREETAARMQSQIDAVNLAYDEILRTERRAGEERVGRTRAIASRSGLLGSDFGEAHLETTKGKNLEVERAVQAERAQRLKEVFGRIDKDSQDEIKARRADIEGNAKEYVDFLAGKQDQARENTKLAAQAGLISLDDLSKEQYQSLLRQTGFDPVTLEAFFQVNKPKNERVEYQSVSTPDGMLLYGLNPSTGEVETKKFDVQLPAGFEVRFTDKGEALAYNPKTQKATPISDYYGQYGYPQKTTKPTETEIRKSAIRDMGFQIDQVVGDDGYINPNDYRSAKKAWVAEGFSSKDFDEAFSTYVNPYDPGGPEAYGLKP